MKLWLIIALLALVSFTYAGSYSSCQNLATNNEVALLTANVSGGTSTCFNISANNVTLDCAGYSITDSNTINKYGIQITGNGATIQNCVIVNYHYGVYFNGGKNGTVKNTSATYGGSSAGATGFYISSSSHNITGFNLSGTMNTGQGLYVGSTAASPNAVITNSTFKTSANLQNAIYISAGGSTLTNVTASTSGSGAGLYINNGGNLIQNSFLYSRNGYGVYAYGDGFNLTGNVIQSNASKALDVSNSNTPYIANNNITTNGTSMAAVNYESAVQIANFLNNFANASGSGSSAISAGDVGDTSDIFTNNTLIANTIGAYFGGGANTFTQNNITANIWVDDEGDGTDVFDDGTSGNIYYFPNNTASWAVFDIKCSGTTPCYANSGTALPFDAATVGGNFTGIGAPVDNHPYTTNGSPPAPAITAVSLTPSPAYTNDTLKCNTTATSGSATSINISFNWFKNGTNQTALAGSINVTNNTNTNIANITSGNLTVGDNWSCSAMAYDGANYSAWNSSANVTISSATTFYAPIRTGIITWFWGILSAGNITMAGNATSWAWESYTPANGKMIRNGSATSWTWVLG
jgi:hypothetical protein